MKVNFAFIFVLVGLLAACRQEETAIHAVETRTIEPSQTPTDAIQRPVRPRRLQAGELVIAADSDDIPAIMAQDSFFKNVDTDEWLDEEYVIGVAIEDQARAYPIRLMSNHELVNDFIGDRRVLISWCPLCFTAIVFDRVVDGRELTFGVSGMLFHDNLVMYDHQTNTLWSQLLGQSLRGAIRQKFLKVIPSILTTWGEWKKLQPKTLVLSADLLGQYDGEVVDPYSGYYRSGAAGLAARVEHQAELPAKALVVGVQINGQQRAYPITVVSEMGVVEDELGGVPLLLVWDDQLQVVYIYRRDFAETTLSFEDGDLPYTVQDNLTGSSWNWRSGQAIGGELVGSQLARQQGFLTFWFAWAGIYPETEVYGK